MRRRIAQTLGILLHVDDTPHRIALAFGIGVFIAFFPVLGIHTLLALGIAFLFRLSRAAILMGSYVNNPWTLAPLYLAGTLVGCAILGVSTEGLASVDWGGDGGGFSSSLFAHLRPYLWPFVLGNVVLGAVGGALGYAVMKAILLRRRRTLVAEEAGSV